MKGSLPAELLEVLARSTTADYVTIDGRGQPVVWPLTPRYQATEGCIDVTVSRAQGDVRVALLFSDAVAMILVQGTAHPEDRDTGEEIDVHVRPERVYVWRGSDLEAEPQLYDAHVDEVRSAHNEEPEVGHAPPKGGGSVWDERLDALGARHPDAVLAFVGPDGFPFAVRVPVRAERDAGLVLVDADPVGAPIEPGLACLCADAPGRRGFHVLGDLDEDQGVWVLRPHRVADPVHVGCWQASPSRSPARRARSGGPSSAHWSARARSGASSAWPAGPSTPPRTAGSAPSTAAATCSTAHRSRGWSRVPTLSCTWPLSCSRRAARRATSTSRGRATCSRRRSRRGPSGWSTRARSPPTASPSASTGSSPRTCPRWATRATPTPPTRPRSRRSSTTR